MADHATGERRDTYDSRRIDGLESEMARVGERVENLREKLDGWRAEWNEERAATRQIQRESAAASRSLRNSIVGGCAVATIIAITERLLA